MKTKIFPRFRIVCVLILCALSIHSQDIESIGSNLKNIKDQSLGLGGGISLMNNFYGSNNIDPRRDQLQWLANVNLNLNFLGIDAPFSLSFSDGNQQFGLPSYAFTGISPTYKWAKAHIGDRNMYFSKYTLSGNNFRGGGLELTPGGFTFKAMYGQLVRANAEDLNSRQAINPAYRRMGWSVLSGYQGGGFDVNFILFSAEDDPQSIADPIEYDVTPASNIVSSLSAKKSFNNKIILDAELARSAFNSDVRAPLSSQFSGVQNTLFGLFKANETARFGNALNTGLSYNAKKFLIRLQYEKIDRGFKTLGSLFFNTDLIHYTTSVSTSLLKNKLNISARGGLEQTNVNDLTKPTNNRFVGSINLAYAPSKKLNFASSYSNFNNATKIRAKEDPAVFIDSLFLAQLTQSASFSAAYKVGQEYNPSSLSAVYSYQNANSIKNDEVIADAEAIFSNVILIFSQQLTDANMNWSASFNYNNSNFAGNSTNTFSPTGTISKSFFNNQWNNTFRCTYNHVMVESGNTSQVVNLSLVSGWNIAKNQNLNLSISYINRANSGGQGVGDFSEVYGNVRYSYSFESAIGGSQAKSKKAKN